MVGWSTLWAQMIAPSSLAAMIGFPYVLRNVTE